jgi:hypothetical protein
MVGRVGGGGHGRHGQRPDDDAALRGARGGEAACR